MTTNVLVVSAEKRNTFTTFFLNGTVDGEEVHIETRYRDILSFHLSLKQTLPKSSLPPFPSKKLFGNMDDKFVEERRQQLEDYFAALLANPAIVSHTTFKNWISKSEHIANLAPSYEDLEQLRQQHQQNMAAAKAPPRPPSNERPFTAAPTPPMAKRSGTPRDSPEKQKPPQQISPPLQVASWQSTTSLSTPSSSSNSSASSTSLLSDASDASDSVQFPTLDGDDYTDADLTAIAAMLLPEHAAAPRSHTFQIAISDIDSDLGDHNHDHDHDHDDHDDDPGTSTDSDQSMPELKAERGVSSSSSASLSIPRVGSFGDTPCNSFASPSRLSNSSSDSFPLLFSPSPTGISINMGTPQNTPCSSLISSGIFLPPQMQTAPTMTASALSAALAVVGSSECECE